MNDLEDDEIVLRVEKDPLIGKTLAGRYEIVSVLGRGGMGVVYKAHQTDTERMVAIKTLHLSKIVDSQVIQKFRSEAQAVSKVRHPNTVLLYDFGVSGDGVPFLVMEMLDGISFRQILKENAPLKNLGKVNHVFQQVCSALAFAHEAGIVHKDLKPENIMICNRSGNPNWVFVLDFGIAGLVESQTQDVREIVGSPPYMSPEQCSMQAAIDNRSDIYSLGVCLFEALTGKFPFQARSAIEMLDCHMNAQALLLKDMGTNFSTYESLSQLISKAMEKRPEKRHQSISEFAADLEDAIKKDSKRGMQLKHRMTLEIDTPKIEDFVELKIEDESTEQSESSKFKGLVEKVQAFVQGDESEEKKAEALESDPKYHFSNCPHCNSPTQQGISLCLDCGRSLASKDDFSKLRAAKGDFSLPKYQDLSNSQQAASRGFSQRSRHAMLKGGSFWTRSGVFIVLGLVIVICTFLLTSSPYVSDFIKKSLSPSFSYLPEKNSNAENDGNDSKNESKDEALRQEVHSQ